MRGLAGILWDLSVLRPESHLNLLGFVPGMKKPQTEGDIGLAGML
jgi:hypothetical protein